MEILTLILNALPYIIITLILLGGAVAMIANQRKSAKEWLLLAVCAAEKELGGGLGKLKLRTTFEAFVKNFPFLAKFVSFETFSKWVDVSLDEMKKLLETNKKIEEYVKGEENG